MTTEAPPPDHQEPVGIETDTTYPAAISIAPLHPAAVSIAPLHQANLPRAAEATGRTLSVKFSRKARPGDYQSVEADLFLTEVLPLDYTDEQIQARARQLFTLARMEVYEQLGVGFRVNQHNVVVEDPPEVPATVAVQQQLGGPGYQQPAPQPVPQQHAQPVQVPAMQQAASAGPGICPQCGQNDWFDNRGDNARRRAGGYKLGPDWKCRNRQCGAGRFDSRGQPARQKVIWPPDYQQYKNNPPEPQQGAPQPVQQAVAPPPQPMPQAQFIPPDEAPF